MSAGLSVGRLARRFGLSRTALLYYDRIGLLSPSGRSSAGYRLYGPEEVARLEAICRYRQVGVPLEQILAILDGEESAASKILEGRLDQLNREMDQLREQQRIVIRLLSAPRTLRRARALDKDRWVAILRSAGLDEAGMHRWHVEFERTAPVAHHEFLVSLGIGPAEVRRIRRWSKRSSGKRD